MQLRFRILSCSSESMNHPASNLLSRHSSWQSDRFCDYPQEITISFYQPMKINSIKITGHDTKICSRINILYHLPQHNERGFIKYGYITFASGNSSEHNPVEVKQLAGLDINALEIRFLLLKNHENKHNFFNQVALSGLAFTGEPFDHVLPSKPIKNRSNLLNFDPQISIFNQLKSNFIRRQQFQQAKQVKQVLELIDKANDHMSELQKEKQSYISSEDFSSAKKVKQSMQIYRNQINHLVSNFYDPQKQMIKSVISDQKLKRKVEQLSKSKRSFEQPQILKKEVEVISEGQPQGDENDFNQSMVSHEERILPAVMSRIKGLGQTQIIPQNTQIGQNQFFENGEQSRVLPIQPQKMSPADQANSSILLEFYDINFIRKLHSKHWQFKLEALQKAADQIKDNQNGSSSFFTKNRLRSFLFIYSLALKSNNFQIANVSLNLMDQLAPIKLGTEYRNDLHNQCENALRGTLKKLGDSNLKIRNMAQKTILRIIESSIFGIIVCYSTITKSYNQKVSPKIRKIKIESIQYMIQKFGVGENGVPSIVADFALKAANDQDSDVRKSAINLARTIRQRGGKQRLDSLLLNSSGVRESIIKKIES